MAVEEIRLAELAVIGCMLMEPANVSIALKQLRAEEFATEELREIFDTCTRLVQKGKPVDAVTVIAEKPELRQTVIHAAQAAPSYRRLQSYMDIVKEDAKRRTWLPVIEQVYTGLLSGGETAEARARLSAMLSEEARDGGEITARQAAHETLEKLEKIRKNGKLRGVTTGFGKLDRILGGLLPGGYYIIAARSGMGKTALALSIARAAAMEGKQVLFISLEMTTDQLSTRMLSMSSYVRHELIHNVRYSNTDYENLCRSADMDWMNNIVWSEHSQLSTIQIRSLIMSQKPSPDIVFIDYIGRIEASKGENRTQEVDKISHDLVASAKLCNVPVVALAQINRDPEKRGKDKRPSGSDIRESDAIFQDADAVMLLYRQSYYDKKKIADEEAELIIDKNRQGGTGRIPLRWLKDTVRYVGVEEDYEEL